MLSKLRNVKGFTLIELMVVVAIIGIILAIAIPYYISYKRTSCDRTAQGDISKLGASLERLGNELIDLNCTTLESFVSGTPAGFNISYLVGPYYGWGGTSAKCGVLISADTATNIVMAAALNGSRPVSATTRYVYRQTLGGGTDMPAITADSFAGTPFIAKGAACYTASMITTDCTAASPSPANCGSAQ